MCPRYIGQERQVHVSYHVKRVGNESNGASGIADNQLNKKVSECKRRENQKSPLSRESLRHSFGRNLGGLNLGIWEIWNFIKIDNNSYEIFKIYGIIN